MLNDLTDDLPCDKTRVAECTNGSESTYLNFMYVVPLCATSLEFKQQTKSTTIKSLEKTLFFPLFFSFFFI